MCYPGQGIDRNLTIISNNNKFLIFDNLSYFLLRQEAINLRNQELDIVKSKVEVSQKQIAQLIENSQQQTNKLMRLKELRNRILRTILT